MPDRAPVPPRVRSPQRTRQLRWLLSGFALVLSLLLVETALHMAPGLLPASFRERYPPHGVELLTPGVLDRTPLTELPLPYGVTPYDGPPPSDLVDFGIATAADREIDRRAVPRLVVPADRNGLPNQRQPDPVDLVLVGDSFTLFAAQLVPPGLQHGLEQQLGARCLNLAVSGIGPQHEAFLLRRLGVPTKPKLVVWFYYGGNDLIDSFWVQVQQSQGIKTLGELFATRRAPRVILPSLLMSFFSDPPAKPASEPLPPFVLQAFPNTRLWFFPNNLRVLGVPPQLLLQNPGWNAITDILRQVHGELRSAGTQLLVVYLPSKPQVYLPHIHADAQLLHRCAMLSELVALPIAEQPEQFLADLMQHRGAQEQAMHNFCAAEGIELWSATPHLEDMAKKGEAAYYATDTHWTANGQLAVLPHLVARIREMGLFVK